MTKPNNQTVKRCREPRCYNKAFSKVEFYHHDRTFLYVFCKKHDKLQRIVLGLKRKKDGTLVTKRRDS